MKGATRTIGSLRRSAADTSRARVTSFSFTSNSSRATRHWASVTTFGRFIELSLFVVANAVSYYLS